MNSKKTLSVFYSRVVALFAMLALLACPAWSADFVLVTDVSESMGNETEDAKQRKIAQEIFLLQTGLARDVRVGLVHFTSDIKKTRDIGELPPPKNQEDWRKLIADHEPGVAAGSTDIAEALDKALELIGKSGDSAGVRAVILVSDGDFGRAPTFLSEVRDGGRDQPVWRVKDKSLYPKLLVGRPQYRLLRDDEQQPDAPLLGEVMEKFAQQGVILYTVPVKPKEVGEAAWKPGYDLLRDLAAATERVGGRTFNPLETSYDEIYGEILSAHLPNKLELTPKNNMILVNPLFRSIMIRGTGITTIQLPSGEEIKYDAAAEVRNDKSGGIGFSWQRDDNRDIVIFHRPGGDSTAEQQRAWEGLWTIDAAPVGGLAVDAFSDLQVHWAKPPPQRLFPHETASANLKYTSDLDNTDAAAWVRPLLQNLTCDVSLRSDSEFVRGANVEADGQEQMFTLPLAFNKPGNAELHLNLKAQFEGVSQDVFRQSHPIVVTSNDPVVMKGIRVRDEAVLFNTSTAEPVRSLKRDDGIKLFVEPDDNYAIRSVKPLERANADYVKRGGSEVGGTFVFALELTEACRNGRSEPLELEIVVRDANANESLLRIPVPRPVLSASDITIRAELQARELGGARLFVGERVTRPLVVRVQGQDVEVTRAPNEIELLLETERGSKPVSAYIDKDASFESRLTYHLQLTPSELDRPGSYRLEPRFSYAEQFGAPLSAADISFRGEPPPVSLSLFQAGDDLPVAWKLVAWRLRAFETARAELVVSPGYEIGETAATVVLRAVSDDQASQFAVARFSVEQDRPANAMIIPGRDPNPTVQPTVRLDLRPTGANSFQPVELDLPSKYFVETLPLQVRGRFSWPEEAPRRAFSKLAVELEFAIRGGRVTERKEAHAKLLGILRSRGASLLKVTTDGVSSLDETSVSMQEPTEQGDPETGPSSIRVQFNFRVLQSGSYVAELNLNRAETIPEDGGVLEIEPLKFDVRERLFQFRLTQLDLLRDPIVDSAAGTNFDTPVPSVAGFDIKAVVSFAANSGPERQKLMAVLLANDEAFAKFDVSAAGDANAVLEKPTASAQKIACRIFDPQGTLIDEFGPYTVQPDRPWDLKPRLTLPKAVPEDLRDGLSRIQFELVPVNEELIQQLLPVKYRVVVRDEDMREEYTAETAEIEGNTVTISRIQNAVGQPVPFQHDKRFTCYALLLIDSASQIELLKQTLYELAVTKPVVNLAFFDGDPATDAAQQLIKSEITRPLFDRASVFVKPILDRTVADELSANLDEADLSVTAVETGGTIMQPVGNATPTFQFELPSGSYSFKLSGKIGITSMPGKPLPIASTAESTKQLTIVDPALDLRFYLDNPNENDAIPLTEDTIKGPLFYWLPKSVFVRPAVPDEWASRISVSAEDTAGGSVAAAHLPGSNVFELPLPAGEFRFVVTGQREAGEERFPITTSTGSLQQLTVKSRIVQFWSICGVILVSVVAIVGLVYRTKTKPERDRKRKEEQERLRQEQEEIERREKEANWRASHDSWESISIAPQLGAGLKEKWQRNSGELKELVKKSLNERNDESEDVGDLLKLLDEQPPLTKVVAVAPDDHPDQILVMEWAADAGRFCWRKLGGNGEVRASTRGDAVGQLEHGLSDDGIEAVLAATKAAHELADVPPAVESWSAHSAGGTNVGEVSFSLRWSVRGNPITRSLNIKFQNRGGATAAAVS